VAAPEAIVEEPQPIAPAAITQSDLPFFAVATHKFVVMCIVTVGLYQFYWLYLQWKRLARATIEPISPFWRTFFAPLWGFSFCNRVRQRGLLEQTHPNWNAAILAVAYFVLTVLWRLPEPWSLISLLNFLPLVPVQLTIEAINARHARGPLPNRSYSTANIAGIVFGSCVLVLAVIGSFLPT
jgi:hypothetical protein